MRFFRFGFGLLAVVAVAALLGAEAGSAQAPAPPSRRRHTRLPGTGASESCAGDAGHFVSERERHLCRPE